MERKNSNQAIRRKSSDKLSDGSSLDKSGTITASKAPKKKKSLSASARSSQSSNNSTNKGLPVQTSIHPRLRNSSKPKLVNDKKATGSSTYCRRIDTAPTSFLSLATTQLTVQLDNEDDSAIYHVAGIYKRLSVGNLHGGPVFQSDPLATQDKEEYMYLYYRGNEEWVIARTIGGKAILKSCVADVSEGIPENKWQNYYPKLRSWGITSINLYANSEDDMSTEDCVDWIKKNGHTKQRLITDIQKATNEELIRRVEGEIETAVTTLVSNVVSQTKGLTPLDITQSPDGLLIICLEHILGIVDKGQSDSKVTTKFAKRGKAYNLASLAHDLTTTLKHDKKKIPQLVKDARSLLQSCTDIDNEANLVMEAAMSNLREWGILTAAVTEAKLRLARNEEADPIPQLMRMSVEREGEGNLSLVKKRVSNPLKANDIDWVVRIHKMLFDALDSTRFDPRTSKLAAAKAKAKAKAKADAAAASAIVAVSSDLNATNTADTGEEDSANGEHSVEGNEDEESRENATPDLIPAVPDVVMYGSIEQFLKGERKHVQRLRTVSSQSETTPEEDTKRVAKLNAAMDAILASAKFVRRYKGALCNPIDIPGLITAGEMSDGIPSRKFLQAVMDNAETLLQLHPSMTSTLINLTSLRELVIDSNLGEHKTKTRRTLSQGERPTTAQLLRRSLSRQNSEDARDDSHRINSPEPQNGSKGSSTLAEPKKLKKRKSKTNMTSNLPISNQMPVQGDVEMFQHKEALHSLLSDAKNARAHLEDTSGLVKRFEEAMKTLVTELEEQRAENLRLRELLDMQSATKT